MIAKGLKGLWELNYHYLLTETRKKSGCREGDFIMYHEQLEMNSDILSENEGIRELTSNR
jgi:hypothetical protein